MAVNHRIDINSSHEFERGISYVIDRICLSVSIINGMIRLHSASSSQLTANGCFISLHEIRRQIAYLL